MTTKQESLQVRRARERGGELRDEKLQNMRTAFEHLDPKAKAETVTIAKVMARIYTASIVKDRLIEDAMPPHLIEAVTSDTVADILSELVEGDEVLDDGEVHSFFRKTLDDLREGDGILDASTDQHSQASS